MHLQRQLVGVLSCHVGCIVGGSRLRSVADCALESGVGVPVPVLRVLQRVRVLLLATILFALQLSPVHPNLHLHLDNVVDARCVRPQVLEQHRCETELSLTETEKGFREDYVTLMGINGLLTYKWSSYRIPPC